MNSFSHFVKDLISEVQSYHHTLKSKPKTSIHEIRKRTKFLRALLKFDSMAPPETKTSLKNISASLAPYRDAQVHVETYKNILDQNRNHKSESLEDILFQNSYFKTPIPESKVLITLDSELGGLSTFTPSTPTVEFIRSQVEESFQRGVQALDSALKSSDRETLHTLRKKTKRLWYQLRFVFGDEITYSSHPVELSDHLCKLLGEIHDLDVFAELIPTPNASGIAKFIDDKRKIILPVALDEAHYLFVEQATLFNTLLTQTQPVETAS